MAISKKDFQNRVDKLVEMGYSPDDALSMVKDDILIDTGEAPNWLNKLTDEQKKVSREARQVSKEVVAGKSKRTRAEDPDKRALIEAIEYSVGELVNYTEDAPNLIVTNPEREIEFTYHGRKFKITLSAPRPPKN